MASVKKADIPKIAAFMPDFWEFIKSVWIPEDQDEYWEDVCNKAQGLYERHECAFAKHMILAYCDYLDIVHKKNGDVNIEQKK